MVEIFDSTYILLLIVILIGLRSPGYFGLKTGLKTYPVLLEVLLEYKKRVDLAVFIAVYLAYYDNFCKKVYRGLTRYQLL